MQEKICGDGAAAARGLALEAQYGGPFIEMLLEGSGGIGGYRSTSSPAYLKVQSGRSRPTKGEVCMVLQSPISHSGNRPSRLEGFPSALNAPSISQTPHFVVGG